MAKYDVARLDELEGSMRKLRRELGVTAFGINYGSLAPGQEGFEHDESGADQEEVYVYVKGSGTLHLDGEPVEVRAGTAVRIDPEVTRKPVAGDEGLEWVAVGAPRGGGYQPPSWG